METQPQVNMNMAQKIAKISQMKTAFPAYREILDFFEPVLRERMRYKSKMLKTIARPVINDAGVFDKLQNGVPLIDKSGMQFDEKIMAAHLRVLLGILHSRTHEVADCVADILKKEHYTMFANTSETHHAPASMIRTGSWDILDFLTKEILNPVLEIYAESYHPLLSKAGWENGYCPMCGEPPMMALIAGENGKRFLICGACATRWPFPRTVCPFCGNDDQRQLSYLFMENDNKYRIEVCDVCRQYLKAVDLGDMSLPVDIEVENIITLHLDMIAMETGYTHPVYAGVPEHRLGESLH